MKVGDRVRVFPRVWDELKKEWTFRGNHKHPYYGKVGLVRSLGVIPTVSFKANTNAGQMCIGVNYDEMDTVSNDTELSVI